MTNNNKTIQHNPYKSLDIKDPKQYQLPKIPNKSSQSLADPNPKNHFPLGIKSYSRKNKYKNNIRVFDKIYKRKIQQKNTLEVPGIINKPVMQFFNSRFHRYEEQFDRKQILTLDIDHYQKGALIQSSPRIKKRILEPIPQHSLKNFSNIGIELDLESNNLNQSFDVPKAKDYFQVLDEYSLHYFIIRKGKTISDTEEFKSYKRTYGSIWNKIQDTIKKIEQFCEQSNIKTANIDGKKLIGLIKKRNLTTEDYVSCFVNMEEVAIQLNIIKLKYKGPNGRNMAALKIQTKWRQLKQIQKFNRIKVLINYVKVNFIFKIIQRFFRVKLLQMHSKKRIKEKNEKIYKDFYERQETFKRNWPEIRLQQRTEIHVNSFNFSELTRLCCNHFWQVQNQEIIRIFRLKDPNLSMIYVSPFPLPQEIVQYYYKMLKLQNIVDGENRLIFMYPNDHDNYPSHTPLNTSLLYSARTIKRIKRLINNKESYIVGGIPNIEDIKLSNVLNSPFYGCIEENKKIVGDLGISFLSNLGIPIPLSIQNILDQADLFNNWAVLFVSNLQISKWMFKIDGEIQGNFLRIGRGVATVIFKKQTLQKLMDQKEAIDPVQIVKLLQKQLKFIEPLNTNLYPTPDFFMKQFFKLGGSVYPLPPVPIQELQTFSINIEVEPNMTEFRILSSYTKIQEKQFNTIGYISPQVSMPNFNEEKLVQVISEGLNKQNLFGFYEISFLQFQDTFQAIQIRPGLKTIINNSLQIQPQLLKGLDQIQFSTFFHMCRIDHIFMDIEKQQGVWWWLVDTLASGMMGLVVVSKDNKEKINQSIKVIEWLQKLNVKDEGGIIGKLRLMLTGRRGKQIQYIQDK